MVRVNNKMSYDFAKEEDAKLYVKNLGIEYRFGCYQEKKPEVCHLLGDYLEAIDKDFQKAGKIYKNNCDHSNFAKSCLKYGNCLATGKGVKKKDHEEALEYYKKGCKLEEFIACYRAGLLSVATSNKNNAQRFKEGISLFEKACSKNNPDACFHLSAICMEGNEEAGIAKNMQRSFEYAVKACELKNVYACANISLMYKKGDGVQKNDEMSEKYKAKAVEIQNELKEQRQITFQEGLPPT